MESVALECGREAAAFIRTGDNSCTPRFASRCHGRPGRTHGRGALATQRNSARPTNILSQPRPHGLHAGARAVPAVLMGGTPLPRGGDKKHLTFRVQ